MKLSILMPSIATDQRRKLREIVLGQLTEQIKALANPGDVEICMHETPAASIGRESSGGKRNFLMSGARGDYVAFVDDDDEVAPDYVRSIIEAIDRDKPDVVTFQLEFTKEGKEPIVWDFQLKHGDHVPLPGGIKGMTANPLCAWRRDLARLVPFLPIGYMDDVLWYRGMIAAGLAKKETHINRVLYRYRFSWSVTSNQGGEARQAAIEHLKHGVFYYWWNQPGMRSVAIGIDPPPTPSAKIYRIPIITHGGRALVVHPSTVELFHKTNIA